MFEECIVVNALRRYEGAFEFEKVKINYGKRALPCREY